MTDKPMLDSEATTAGRIAQSVDRAIEKSTCPLCGADYAMDTPYKVRFTCGTFMSPLRKQFDSERGDVQSKACRLRRQLAEAQERAERERRMTDMYRRSAMELNRWRVSLSSHNARLRTALEDLVERAERARRVLQESGRREGLRPDQCGWGVLDTTAARAALAALDREEGGE